ncbi:Wzz/FepE/Etk N-terminal domain-containing protein [uncultured Psychrosphaera sp.]|uniref:Wzz/FepE/Etk N-terminal domain-containing protein n=1 Tax=uncultured Psychrosphaera sp. TaxID=1403522 RepID=UPI002610FEBB|nr:Wzz/FepE/Etk N-terminal domain-containing protein [uncultured Psychrosphaera sp.]
MENQKQSDSQELAELKSKLVKYENMAKYDDEIDLKELWRAIWQGKLLVIFITAIFSIASVFYALSLPDIYKSEALLAPAEEQDSNLGGMASQLGGLASLAGVNLGGGKADKTTLALEVIKSRAFTFKFIEKYDITADLMAVKGWELESNKLIYDESIYNPHSKKWLRDVKAPLKSQPSLQEAYKVLQKIVNVEQDKSNAMITISVEHYSPYVAKKWVDLLISASNEEMKSRDLLEANNSIAYLTEQLEHTRISGLQEILYQLIEEQTKTIMFANVRDEYILKTIDPALVPELKSGPQRALICVLGFMLGGMLAMLIILIRYFNSKD